MDKNPVVNDDLIKRRRRRFTQSPFTGGQSQISRVLVCLNQDRVARIGFHHYGPGCRINSHYCADQTIGFALRGGAMTLVERDKERSGQDQQSDAFHNRDIRRRGQARGQEMTSHCQEVSSV